MRKILKYFGLNVHKNTIRTVHEETIKAGAIPVKCPQNTIRTLIARLLQIASKSTDFIGHSHVDRAPHHIGGAFHFRFEEV